MPNEVQIKVTTDKKQADEGLEKVDDRVKKVGKSGGAASKTLGSFTRALGIVGLSGLSASFILKSFISTNQELARSAALTSVILEGFGPDFVKSLEKIKRPMADLVLEFGFTHAAAQEAFGIIVKESRSAGIGVDDLRFAMALARLTGMDLAAAAKIVGQAMLGNVEPLRNVIGEMDSLEEAQQRVIKGGKESTSTWQILTGTLKDAFNEAVRLTGKLWNLEIRMIGDFFTLTLPGWWTEIKEFFGKTWDISIAAAGSFFTKTLPSWWQTVSQWFGKVLSFRIDFSVIGQQIIDRVARTLREIKSLIDRINPFGGGNDNRGQQDRRRIPGGGAVSFPSNGGGGGITINIINPVVDNESRLTEMADQIFRQLEIRERRGLSLT